VVGAVAIVVLTARFPPKPGRFSARLGTLGAACGFVATLLRNFCGLWRGVGRFTAAVIASDELGAVGGANNDVFMLAVARASEICYWYHLRGRRTCKHRFGGARHRLAAQLAMIAAESLDNSPARSCWLDRSQSKTRPVRRDLIRRVTGARPGHRRSPRRVLGPSPSLTGLGGGSGRPVRCPIRLADGGCSIWSFCEGDMAGRKQTLCSKVFQQNCDPCRCKSRLQTGRSILPTGARPAFAAARNLTNLAADTPSLRLLADSAAEALIGVRRALKGCCC